jgi:hypothetical protein
VEVKCLASWLLKENWHDNRNNGAVKSILEISSNNILVYVNIGIWVTDNTFSGLTNFTTVLGIQNAGIFVS